MFGVRQLLSWNNIFVSAFASPSAPSASAGSAPLPVLLFPLVSKYFEKEAKLYFYPFLSLFRHIWSLAFQNKLNFYFFCIAPQALGTIYGAAAAALSALWRRSVADVGVVMVHQLVMVMVMLLLMRSNSNPMVIQMSAILSLPLPLHVQQAIALGNPFSGIPWWKPWSSFTFFHCGNDKYSTIVDHTTSYANEIFSQGPIRIMQDLMVAGKM